MKEILDKINQDIADCISGKFKFNLTDPTYIPQETDANFNSTYGMAKQGASMISCTLVVNIRNLTEIINANSTKVAGKIYTAFIKAIHHICGIYQAELNTAQLDKILILFATRNSFRNAVECAVTINTITKKLFDKAFNLQGLKLDIGIGAAYGSLICFKANSSRDEPDELHTGYSKIIWTGEPINAAQKLSQIAAFTQTTELVKVSYSLPNPYHPDSSSTITKNYYYKDFLATLEVGNDGLKSQKGKIIKIETFTFKENLAPILLTSEVYNGYIKRLAPTEEAEKEGWIKISSDVFGKTTYIFGGDVVWDI